MLDSDIVSILARSADEMPALPGETQTFFRARYSMRIRLFFAGIGILACAWIPSAAENECLRCHGPFDKIIEASAKYVAPSGETTSPHRYVPHDSKEEEDIPECSHCHTAHPLDPLPAKGSIDLSKVGVQWCYGACHHEKDLTSCKKCHP